MINDGNNEFIELNARVRLEYLKAKTNNFVSLNSRVAVRSYEHARSR